MTLRLLMFPYRNQIGVPFVRTDSIDLRTAVKPFVEKIEVGEARDLVMRLIHEKLVFGMDPFLLGQLDSLNFGTIDTFPLNVQ